MIAQEFSFSEIPAADRLLVLQSPHPIRKEVFCRDNSLASTKGVCAMNLQKVKTDLIALGMKKSDFDEYGHGFYVVVNPISRHYFENVLGLSGVGTILSIDGNEPDFYDVCDY